MEIRLYVLILRRAWRVLALGMLVPAAAALVISLVWPPTYEAQAGVVPYKSKTEVTLDPRIQTLSEDDLVRLTSQDPRRQTLAALARSPQVLGETLAELPDEWAGRWSGAALADATAVETAGNLLQLTVRSWDPNEAAAVANLWAEVFVRTANAAFRAPAGDTELDAQVAGAYAEYAAAQAALTAFQGDNQIDELTLAIAREERAARDLQDAYQAAAADALRAALAARQRIPLLLSYAQALRDELAAAPATEPVDASAQLAPLFLEAASLGTVISGTITVPAAVQVAAPTAPVTAGEARAALDRLTATLEVHAESLDGLIVAHSRAVLATPGLDGELATGLADLQADLGELRGQLEAEQARQLELTTARDLAWDTYLALTRKSVERSIAALAAETEVVLATRALPPGTPVAPQPVLNTAVAAGLGLLLALGYVFARAQFSAP